MNAGLPSPAKTYLVPLPSALSISEHRYMARPGANRWAIKRSATDLTRTHHYVSRSEDRILPTALLITVWSLFKTGWGALFVLDGSMVISAVIVSGGCNHTVVIQLTEIFTIGPTARTFLQSIIVAQLSKYGHFPLSNVHLTISSYTHVPRQWFMQMVP